MEIELKMKITSWKLIPNPARTFVNEYSRIGIFLRRGKSLYETFVCD